MRTRSLEQELNEKIALKSVNHRNRFARLFLLRYMEMLPSLIKCKGGERTSIDFLKMEIGLITNYDIVLGKNQLGKWCLVGYTKNRDTITDKTKFFINQNNRRLNQNDIIFISNRKNYPEKMKEITLEDDGKTGEFVVIRNKTLSYVSDEEIIDHYTIHLAEIVNSRFSLALQSKVMTFFKGNIGDETVNQIVEELYNGSPYSKVTEFFDPSDQIITINNGNISSNLSELKREYQNIIGELNAMLGIDTLGVDKESGVSETEAQSSNAFSNSIANIKLASRQSSYDLIEKNTNGEIKLKAIYNNQVASEMQKLDFVKEVVK